MSSFSEKRSQRNTGKQPKQSLGEGAAPDKISFIGSVNSNMSTSAAESRLEALQLRVKELEKLSKGQQETIQKLMSLINKRHSR